MEKLLKSYVVKATNKFPPPIHNLLRLIDIAGLTNNLIKDQLILMAELNKANIRARYDDYKKNFNKKCDKYFTENIFNQTKIFFKWLTEKF